MEFSFSSLDMCGGAAGDDRACGGSLDEEPWLRLIDLLPDKLRVALVDSTFGVNSCEAVPLFAVGGRFLGESTPEAQALVADFIGVGTFWDLNGVPCWAFSLALTGRFVVVLLAGMLEPAGGMCDLVGGIFSIPHSSTDSLLRTPVCTSLLIDPPSSQSVSIYSLSFIRFFISLL